MYIYVTSLARCNVGLCCLYKGVLILKLFILNTIVFIIFVYILVYRDVSIDWSLVARHNRMALVYTLYFNFSYLAFLVLLVVDQQSYWDGSLSGVQPSIHPFVSPSVRPLFVTPITHKRGIGIASYLSGELLK